MLDTPPMKRLLGWVVLTVALDFSSALCALRFGLRRFDRLVKRDVEEILARATTTAGEAVVTEEMLKDLPEPVRRYLRHTGIVGKPFVDSVYLEQKGQMYLNSNQGWVPLDAKEHYDETLGFQLPFAVACLALIVSALIFFPVAFLVRRQRGGGMPSRGDRIARLRVLFALAGIERYLKVKRFSNASSATAGQEDTSTLISPAEACAHLPC